jgi:hypothetical protein
MIKILMTIDSRFTIRCKKQADKFDKVRKTKYVRVKPLNNTVVNLPGKPFVIPTLSVLSKKLNFAIVPRTVPYEDIICN